MTPRSRGRQPEGMNLLNVRKAVEKGPKGSSILRAKYKYGPDPFAMPCDCIRSIQLADLPGGMSRTRRVV